jgi:hypothetical protein
VRLQLNEDIENLRRNLMILNIVVLPLLFVALMGGYGYWRRKRRHFSLTKTEASA